MKKPKLTHDYSIRLSSAEELTWEEKTMLVKNPIGMHPGDPEYNRDLWLSEYLDEITEALSTVENIDGRGNDVCAPPGLRLRRVTNEAIDRANLLIAAAYNLLDKAADEIKAVRTESET